MLILGWLIRISRFLPILGPAGQTLVLCLGAGGGGWKGERGMILFKISDLNGSGFALKTVTRLWFPSKKMTWHKIP